MEQHNWVPMSDVFFYAVLDAADSSQHRWYSADAPWPLPSEVAATVCWIVPQYERTRDGEGLPGMPPQFAIEEDSNFTLLLTLYVIAAAVSVAGSLSAAALRRRVRRPGLHSFYAYFIAQVVFNTVLLVGFLANRCAFHNLVNCGMSAGSWSCAAVGGGWGVAAKVAVLSAFVGGILTNGILELGVFHSLRGLAWVSSRQRLNRADHALGCLVVLQLGSLALVTPATLAAWSVMVSIGPNLFLEKLGIVETEPGLSGSDLGRPMIKSAADVKNAIAAPQIVFGGFGGIHVLVSLWLLVKAIGIACRQPKGHEARRVAVASCIALTSSFLCYANFAAVWINWYTAMACDSIVNDACVLAVLRMGDATQYSKQLTSESVADKLAAAPLASLSSRNGVRRSGRLRETETAGK